MGIFINLMISKSVTKEEWEKVYEETLHLIKHLPLAEKRKVKIHGIDTICLVKTEERKESYGWNAEKTRIGWDTVGDYESMKTAEDYYLPRDLVGDNEVDPQAGDAMFAALPAYLDYDWKDERFERSYDKWGAKTQGEPYHMYLLAVAALIEARLGEKAFTYGDITRGQFKKAVEIANRYLENPIDLPDRCYMDRLLNRVIKFPLPANEQLAVFENFFLGVQDADFGIYMRKMFDEDVIAEYWKSRFDNCAIGTIGFDRVINDYLLWGFGLKELCEYVNYESEDGNLEYEKFITRIMDAKLHLKDKNCADPLKIDQDVEQPYGIGTLFAQFAFAGANNKKVDRYIPIEDIREELYAALSSKCNVKEIINNYLSEETKQVEININSESSEEAVKAAATSDLAETLNQIMNIKKEQLKAEQDKYDIDDFEDLIFYEKGDIIHPSLEKSLAGSMRFLCSLLEEDKYKELKTSKPEACCRWLVEQNRHILIRDIDWDKVFTEIEKDINSFERYYSLFRVKMNGSGLVEMCTALMINDDLYERSKILMNEIPEED